MKQHYDPDALSQALAEPSRRAILELLRSGQKSVGELVVATALKQPNVSNHLARMREQGIVRSERLGRHVYYSIALPVAELLMRLHETTADPLRHHAAAVVADTEASLITDAEAQAASPEAAAETAQWEPTVEDWREACFQAIHAGNEDRANALVNDLLARRIDLETIYLEMFQWAMRRIGELYVQGTIDEAQEHLASEITERMMSRVAQFYTPVARKPYRALFGGVAGNWHTLGLRMLADSLRIQGWDALFLGANVPTASFLAMATSANTDLVVVSCMMETQWAELKKLLNLLQVARRELEGVHYRIVAGGQYLNDNPHLLQELPIDFSAPTLREFAATVDRVYPVQPPAKNS